MSNMDNLLAEMDRDEEVRQIEDQKYFAEQDKKFKDLQTKLHLLKDENKKQMDIIISSLDQLILSKNIVEQTLDHVDEFDDSSSIPDLNELTVVDLLSKVTGYIDDIEDSNTTNIATSSDESHENVPSENAAQDSKECNTEKEDVKIEPVKEKKDSVKTIVAQEEKESIKAKVLQEKKDVKVKPTKEKKDKVKVVKDSMDVQMINDAI